MGCDVVSDTARNPGFESLTDERVAFLLNAAKQERDTNGAGSGNIPICAVWEVSDLTIDELIQLLEIYEVAGT